MVNHVVPPPQSMSEIAWGFVPRQSNLGRDQAIAWLAAPVRNIEGIASLRSLARSLVGTQV